MPSGLGKFTHIQLHKLQQIHEGVTAMSIVIRELVIRARLEEAEPAARTNGTVQAARNASLSDEDVEHIVALSVEKVMETLERKKER